MKSLFLIILMALIWQDLTAQQPGNDFYQPGALRAKRLLPGDSLKVSLDTLYLMNRFTFQLMNEGFKNNSAMHSLMEESILLYENQLEEKDRNYDQLKSLALEEDAGCRNRLRETEEQLSVLRLDLNTANSKLEDSQQLAVQLQEDLKAQRWRNIRGKAGWGLGGLVAGMLIMLVFN
ncbi:MAG: hypothetical protein U0T82_00160 [Bacteroidales bacterium]